MYHLFFAIVPKILFAPTPTACKVLILATGISFDMQRSSFFPVPCTSNTNSFNWRLVLISKFLLNQEKYGGIMGTGYKKKIKKIVFSVSFWSEKI